jgi:hypothetical protein
LRCTWMAPALRLPKRALPTGLADSSNSRSGAQRRPASRAFQNGTRNWAFSAPFDQGPSKTEYDSARSWRRSTGSIGSDGSQFRSRRRVAPSASGALRLRCACVAPALHLRGTCVAPALHLRCDCASSALRTRCACAKLRSRGRWSDVERG